MSGECSCPWIRILISSKLVYSGVGFGTEKNQINYGLVGDEKNAASVFLNHLSYYKIAPLIFWPWKSFRFRHALVNMVKIIEWP